MLNLDTLTGFESFFIGFSSLLGAMSMIFGAIICPIVFNRSIIPAIEKRIGKKLEFSGRYDYMPFGRSACFYEVGLCVASEYCLSFLRKSTKNIRFFKNYALIKANFDITTFS